jgi:vacuolar-type H+-ATPase subunit C/Vma6
MALARTFAARATRAARRGGRILRAFAAWIVDLENAWALLQAPEWGPDVEAADLFLPGGRALRLERFSELSRAGVDSIHDGLADAFAGSPFRRLFVAESAGENRFERRALGAQIDWCRAMARLQPLGPPVVLGVLLRIRAEAFDIRVAAWSAALLAPAGASRGGG